MDDNSYLLFLSWVSVDYSIADDKSVLLRGAYFSGPVLTRAAKVKDKDFIDLDFTEQYITKVDGYYIARLSWSSIKYVGGIVYLGDCILSCRFNPNILSLKQDDFIIIDTSMHEEKTHPFFLVYPSKVSSALGEPYVF